MPTPRGFASGDFDPAYALDDKFKRLGLALSRRDYLAAEGLWWELVAAGWREARRSTIDRAVPDAPADLVEALRTAGLIDSRGMLPRRTFDRWIGAALTRREAERIRKAGQRSGVHESAKSDSRGTERFRPVRLSRGTPTESLQDRYTGTDRPSETPHDGGGAGGTEYDLEAWVSMSTAVEAITGRSHGLRSPFAGLGEKALELAASFGTEATVAAFRRAAVAAGTHPDPGQVVLGASNLLRPIPTGRLVNGAAQAEADRQRSERARADTSRRTREYAEWVADGQPGAYDAPQRVGELIAGPDPQDTRRPNGRPVR